MIFRLCVAIPYSWNCLRKACSTIAHQGYDYPYYWAGTIVRGGIDSQKANVWLITLIIFTLFSIFIGGFALLRQK